MNNILLNLPEGKYMNAIHTHLVPMLWHFALVPVSCLALVVMTKEIVSLLFRRRPDLVASH